MLDSSKWNFYLYNFIPLTYRTFSYDYTGNVNIFDASCLYTSSKNNKFFFEEDNFLYGRCSYNKLIFPDKNNNSYRVTNNFDGYGLKFDNIYENNFINTSSGLTLSSDQNNYNTNLMTSKITLQINLHEDKYYYTNATAAEIKQGAVPSNTNFNIDSAIGLHPSDTGLSRNIVYFYAASPFSYIQSNTLKVLAGAHIYNIADVYGSNFGSAFANLAKQLTSTGDNIFQKMFTEKLLAIFPNTCLTTYCFAIGSVNTGNFANVHEFIGNSSGNNITTKMYTINNLFMSTLNYANNLGTGKVIYNNQTLFNSFIISNQASGDGKKKTKGSLKLNLDSMSIVIDNNQKIIKTLDQTNIDAINWPSWINLLNSNSNKYDHKILNVIYNPSSNNYSSKATYYVFTSYADNIGDTNYQMYYFGAVEKSLEKGVTTDNTYPELYQTFNVKMDPLTRRFYLFAKVKV